ncbi:MAG: phage tail tube protein [Kiritimatiellia bacterium]|nr:phage tail tube protein [Kiritimatiellia bacterium]
MRNTTLLAKVETGYGVDIVPTGAANAMLVSDVTITHTYANVGRDLIRSFMGGSEELVGTKHVSIECTVELQGSGTAGTAPAWGPLLRACGFAESDLTTPDRIEYDPVSTAFESVSIYYYMDGALHKALGCRGNVEINAAIGDRPTLKFSLLGIDAGVTAATPSGVSYADFKTPLVVTDANVAEFLMGCTYATGAFSGGSAVCSRGLTLNVGNDVQYIQTLCEGVDIVSRAATGSLSLDLAAAAEVTAMAAVEANTLSSIGMRLGTSAGYITRIFVPYAQRTNPKYEDVSGRAHVAFDLRCVPGATGNDEIKIILT